MTKARVVRWILGALVTLACVVVGTALWIYFEQTGECSPDVHAVVIAAHVHEGKAYSVQMVTTEFLEKAPIVALYEGDEPANGCESRPRSSLATYTLDEDAGWFDVKTVVVRSLHRLDVTLAGEAEAAAAEHDIHVDWSSTRWDEPRGNEAGSE